MAPHIWIHGEVDPKIAAIVDDYSTAKHERQPHGIVFVNGVEVATTLQCPHCGGHFVSYKGSGHRRSFCVRHMAVTCGKPACLTDCVDAHPEFTQAREL